MSHARPAGFHRSAGRRRLAAFAVVLLLSTHAAPGWAAKIFRCGNAFQDQPCPEPKPPEQRPAERSAAARDAAPCGSATREVNGRDCVVRTATRDPQTTTVVEPKR